MKYWHVLKDDEWYRVTSAQRPYGRMVHLVSVDCKNKACGSVYGTNLLQEARANALRK